MSAVDAETDVIAHLDEEQVIQCEYAPTPDGCPSRAAVLLILECKCGADYPLCTPHAVHCERALVRYAATSRCARCNTSIKSWRIVPIGGTK